MKYKNKEAIYKSEHSAIFNTYSLNDYAPKSFIDFVVDHIFDKEIEIREWSVAIKHNYRYLYCAMNQIYNRDNITFTIGEYAYTIDLFYDNPYGDYWILGTDFYSEYNVHFDYEESKIHFYSVQGVSKIARDQQSAIAINNNISIEIVFINICLIIMVMIMKIKH